MYAQLCKRLSIEAQNFEYNDKTKKPDQANNNSTFLTILLKVCRDKFQNRSSELQETNQLSGSTNLQGKESQSKSNTSASAQNGKNNGSSNATTREEQINQLDEEERKYIAKQKMLGNVKFIGELFLLEMLSEKTLHTCIQELLSKSSQITQKERCENMECLSQIIRTCGKVLDTEKSKTLMDQYFERIDHRSQSNKYPPRIRFMLRDLIELRRNGWVPRKSTTTEAPVPMQQLRPDDNDAPIIKREQRNIDRDSDSWMSKTQFNYQPNVNYNSPLIMNTIFQKNSNPVFQKYPTVFPNESTQNNSSIGGNFVNRDYRDGNNVMGVRSGIDRNNDRNLDRNSDRMNSIIEREIGMSGPGGYRNNNNQRNNQNHYNNHSNYNNHNRYNKHNNNQYSNSPHSHNYNNNNANMKQLPPRFSQLQDLSSKNFKNFSSQNSPVVKQNNLQTNHSQSQHSNQQQQQQQQQQPQQQQQQSQNQQQLYQESGQQQQQSQNQQQSQSTETFDTFRPPINSLLYKATNSTRQTAQLPITQQPRPASASSIENSDSLIISSRLSSSTNNSSDVIAPVPLVPPQSSNNILNKDQVVIKPASQEKQKQNKKDKGPNKEEYVRRVLIFVKETLATTSTDNENASSVDDCASAFFELKIPDKYMRDAVTTILNEIIDKGDAVYDRVIEFLTNLKREGKLQNNALLDSFKTLINSMNDSPVPRITTLVATLLSRSVAVKLCKLADVASYTENGAHYPLFLLVLQQLYKTLGKQNLLDIFNESKVNLMSSLPEADRTKDRMAEILEDRNLSFLYPLLKLQGELQKQIQADPNPQTLYKWIKDNVESICYSDPGFITAIMNVILKYVTQETTLADGIDPTVVPEKSLIDKELQLLKKYCPVLNAFLYGNSDLQLVAIFAMQVFCYSYNFPKGMLLRWFSTFYENNVIEEESYMRWKEDLSDVYPGKGKALFQVNSYLTYLEEAEEEEDDDEE